MKTLNNLVIENDFTADYLPDGTYTGTLNESELWLDENAAMSAACVQDIRRGFSHQLLMPDDCWQFVGHVTMTVAGDKLILNSRS